MYRFLIVSVILTVFLLPRREQDMYYTECPTNNDTIGKVVLFLTELPLDIRLVSVINAYLTAGSCLYLCLYLLRYIRKCVSFVFTVFLLLRVIDKISPLSIYDEI